MKTFPYIGESTQENFVAVVYDSSTFNIIDKRNGLSWKEIGFHNSETDCFTNITREYLANTYGKVESKEHAEFIVKLAEVAKCSGLEVARHKIANGESFKGIYFNFYTDNEALWFSFHYEMMAKNRGEKLITIPLPPKQLAPTATQEEEFEMVQIEKNNGDNLLFGGEDKCEEWPKVGSIVEWGLAEKGEVKSLSDGFAWVKRVDKEYTTVYISSLRKPKTPEEDLASDIEHAIHYFEGDKVAGRKWLMNKYNITKKPQ